LRSTFESGPARELWSRYNARIDDTLVAHAIVTGLLPRETIPAELLEALRPVSVSYQNEQSSDATLRLGA
jgi:hypothetical protein